MRARGICASCASDRGGFGEEFVVERGGRGAEEDFTPTRLEALLRWAQQASLAPYWFATSCCRIELEAAQSARFDLERLGSEAPRYAPAQSDLLVVAGTITRCRVPLLREVYAEMREPKWVMAIGACTSARGPYQNYATASGLDGIVPVDVHVPGCPPRPEAILDGLLKLHATIRRGGPRHAVGDQGRPRKA